MVLDEKWLGLATSLTSSMLANSANYVAVKQGIPDSITLPVILIGFGNIAALYLDVLFAKRGFGRLNAEVPYTNIKFRNNWFLSNVVGTVGVKYFAIAVMDGILVYWIYRRVQRWFSDKNIFERQAVLRDAILAACVTSFTFLIYGNYLRFNWALQDVPSRGTEIYAGVVAIISVMAYVYGEILK
jgi:hypothetical protein